MDTILAATREADVKHITVVGAGFVGLEVVEQLHRLGIQVTLVERLDQVLPPMDPFMAKMLSNHLEPGDRSQVRSIDRKTAYRWRSGYGVELSTRLPSIATDFVIVGAGVRPRTQLAVAAGLKLGSSGGVSVNAFMQTMIHSSTPSAIWLNTPME